MTAAVLYGKERLEIETVDVPNIGAGDVLALGENVQGFQIGQRVMAANSAPCGECYSCCRDQENLCENLVFNNGAYAEYIRIPERIVQKNLHVIEDHVGYQDAALAEPLACVLHGLEECALRAGDTLAVIGLGPIGMMFVRLAKVVYGARVIAIGRRQPQLDRAARMGADELILNSDGADVVGAVKGM